MFFSSSFSYLIILSLVDSYYSVHAQESNLALDNNWYRLNTHPPQNHDSKGIVSTSYTRPHTRFITICETPSWVNEAHRAHRNQLLIEIELNSTSKYSSKERIIESYIITHTKFIMLEALFAYGNVQQMEYWIWLEKYSTM